MVARSWVSAREVEMPLIATPRRASRPPRWVGDRDRVVARGDLLGGLDQAAETDAHHEPREDGGRCHAERDGHDPGHRLTVALDDPGGGHVRVIEEQDPDHDRSHDGQDPQQAHHAHKATWEGRFHGPAGRTGARPPEVPGRLARTSPDPSFGSTGDPRPAILRPSSKPSGMARETRRSAIALASRIGRPVRRPSDQTTAIRRSVGGAKREMSIPVPRPTGSGIFDSGGRYVAFGVAD